MESTREPLNYVFYVSDMDVLPNSGHFRKMDAGRGIAEHICMFMSNSRLVPYTEYDGEMLKAETVGIVFPTHTWGISLAVYSFIQHLRVSGDTEVYAVAVGESLSEAVDYTLVSRLKPLRQFERSFGRQGFGDGNNIYVRCIDRKREPGSTEDYLYDCTDSHKALVHIMDGLLFHSMSDLMEDNEVRREAGFDIYDISRNRAFDMEVPVAVNMDNNDKNVPDIRPAKRKLDNVYLSGEFLSGVKLCRVM